MRALLIVLLLAPTLSAATTNNDDSCDIGLYPAATLLLPYFEVETASRGVDTFFTVTNISKLPQIAHVTVWTDWAYPVLNFNLFLTGYDTQSISMYDVIVNGIIAPTNPNLTAGGTSSNTKPGSLSVANDSNPNLFTAGCDKLPGILDSTTRRLVQAALVVGIFAFTSGPTPCGTTSIGSEAAIHRTATTAVGYVTIDVTSRCSATFPTDPAYFAGEILFDNVLTGDYQTIDRTPGSNYAGGNPLVHIRAVPEGGPAGSFPPSNASATPLPYTFYGRYINGQSIGGVRMIPHLDRRQPLGSTFAARWIQGGPTSFNTQYKIWREGVSGPVTCARVLPNASLSVSEFVRFDEHENPNLFSLEGCTQLCIPQTVTLPATSIRATAGGTYPILNSPAGDVAGWMYLNLDSGQGDATLNSADHPNFTRRRPSQNWVVVSMTGAGSSAGLFGTESDATSLGNGCSPSTPAAPPFAGAAGPIGPTGGVLVCPPGFNVPFGQNPCTGTGTNVNP